MAAPAFGTIGTLFGSTSSTPAIAVPASVASGDIVVVVMFTDVSTTTITAFPTGFAEAANSPQTVNSGGGGSYAIHVSWKRATGADSGTYGFTLSANVFSYAYAVRYTGCVASGNPWDVTTSADGGATSQTTTPNVALTTTGPDEMLFHVGESNNGDAGTWSAPATYSLRSASGGSVVNISIADLVQTAAAGTGNIHSTSTASGQTGAWFGALIGTTVAGGSVPWNPQRTIQTSDPGETWWTQRDRRDANTVGSAANPLVSPLDSAWQAGGTYWHLYAAAADQHTAARVWQPQQRRYSADLSMLATAELEGALLGSYDDLARHRSIAATHADRRMVPQQRPYMSDPRLLTTALLENELLGSFDDLARHRHAGIYTDRRLVPQQRAYVSVPGMLDTALLENGLLGGFDDVARHRHAAQYVDRRLVPQQRPYISVVGLLGTALLENELLGGADTGRRHTTATHVSRWWMPQQPKRDGTTPGLLDQALLENELLGSFDDLARHRHVAEYVDRREVPQQRPYISPPGLLDTALLENELLGGAGTPQRYLTPATHTPRWWMPQQPARQTWYFDAGPGTPPLTLAYGAGGTYWAVYNEAGWQPDRRVIPTQRPYVSDPALLGPALTTDPTLAAWLPSWLAYNTAAVQTGRNLFPQQRPSVLDPSMIDQTVIVGTGALGVWFGPEDVTAFTVPRVWLDPSLLPSPNPPDITTAGWLPGWLEYNRAATHVDRRLVPQQRAYISDPNFYPTVAPTDPLTLAWGAGGNLWHLVNTAADQVDRRMVPQQRRYLSPPGLLATALLEDALLGSADDLRRRVLTAAYWDRRLAPQQRAYFDPSLLATALLENELLGGAGTWGRYNLPATHADRREVPQQRPYVSDPLLLLAALLENELLGGADGLKRYLTPATHPDRRLYPTQRVYLSDPLLLATALLEVPLLGAVDNTTRHTGWYTDRRQVPWQPSRYDPAGLVPPPPADPLLLAGAVGGDLWRRYTTAVLTDRWVPLPWQPPRQMLFFGTGVVLERVVFGRALAKWAAAISTALARRYSPPGIKWTLGGGLLTSISDLSTEYVRVEVAAVANGVAVDPTADGVQFAFLAGYSDPASGDWKTGSWDAENGRFYAQCLVGPAGTVTLGKGPYNVWVKIAASPETIVRQVGQLQIT